MTPNRILHRPRPLTQKDGYLAIKASGAMLRVPRNVTQFFSRPAALVLGGLTTLTWLVPLYPLLLRRLRPARA